MCVVLHLVRAATAALTGGGGGAVTSMRGTIIASVVAKQWLTRPALPLRATPAWSAPVLPSSRRFVSPLSAARPQPLTFLTQRGASRCPPILFAMGEEGVAAVVRAAVLGKLSRGELRGSAVG